MAEASRIPRQTYFLRCRQSICQELRDLFFGEEGQLCVGIAYRLWHDARQKSHKNVSFGFCSSLNQSKKVKVLYKSACLSEVLSRNQMDLIPKSSFTMRGTRLWLLLFEKWPEWTSYLRFDSGKNLPCAWWSIRLKKAIAFTKRNIVGNNGFAWK